MTEEQLKVAIHFQTINTPCCGNCRFFQREWEDTRCKHPQNIWKYPEPSFSEYDNEISFNKEHDVCDRFETARGEEKK